MGKLTEDSDLERRTFLALRGWSFASPNSLLCSLTNNDGKKLVIIHKHFFHGRVLFSIQEAYQYEVGYFPSENSDWQVAFLDR
jgi:hypothetical protein